MVLCTDGLANVGLGALDDFQTDGERTAAEAFYENLGRAVIGRDSVIPSCSRKLWQSSRGKGKLCF